MKKTILLVYNSIPRHTRATKILLMLKKGAKKLKFFCLKNASIGWRAEQSGTTQSSHVDGSLGAKPPCF